MSNKFYLTTSIAYVNAAPHLGFALELIQSDVIARFHRASGDSVFFLTGTDEHGAKIVKAATAAGKNPKDFVDENAAKFKALKDILNISWDDFIRTSDQNNHWPNVVALWNKLVEAGDIYKKNYKGLYCVGHEAFVTEKDLSDGKCKDHGKEPEIIEEENYFFKLSKYASQVRGLITSGKLQITPEGRAREITNFIDQEVEDISFSRPRKDLSWGVPVPGDDTQTVYVWADALSNYLYPKDQWPADLHCIGKDILRFHALFWPAMLLSAKLPLPKSIFVHGHITVDGQKMSKTLGNVVDPVELVKKYGADAVRYYLLREIPSTDDGDFSYKKFEERYNADLANGLGNFTARVLTLASKLEGSELKITDNEAENKIQLTSQIIKQKMADYRFSEALASIWELISFGDAYINEKKPWETKDAVVVGNLVFLLKNIANLLIPFLPQTATKIRDGIEGRTKINLFPRI